MRAGHFLASVSTFIFGELRKPKHFINEHSIQTLPALSKFVHAGAFKQVLIQEFGVRFATTN